jgi:hypothetical protein
MDGVRHLRPLPRFGAEVCRRGVPEGSREGRQEVLVSRRGEMAQEIQRGLIQERRGVQL